jgi:hypothetical protein
MRWRQLRHGGAQAIPSTSHSAPWVSWEAGLMMRVMCSVMLGRSGGPMYFNLGVSKRKCCTSVVYLTTCI